LIQLTAPEPGTWQVERAAGGEQDMAIIGASTLSLAVTISPDYLEAVEPFTLQASLLEHGQPLRDPQRLQAFTIQAELTMPTGERRSMPLQPGPDAGVFTATSSIPETIGQYGFVVQASSATVQRQRTLAFIPQPRCFIPHVVSGPEVVVQVTLTDGCPEFAALELATGYVQEQEREPATWLPLTTTQPRLFQVVLPTPATEVPGQVLLRLRGQRGRQPPFTVYKGPLQLRRPQPVAVPQAISTPQPVLPPVGFNWWAFGKTVGWQLLVVNSVLGVCAGGGWHLYRYTRNRRASHG
jgi:hypothetical protein